MQPLPPTLLRLLSLPALAGLVVLWVAGISFLEIEDPEETRTEEPPETLEVLRRVDPCGPEPRTAARRAFTLDEALGELGERRPHPAALEALWALPEERPRLLDLLLSGETPEDTRLDLLARFLEVEPEAALEGARAVLETKGLSEGPLRLAAFEVLALEGGADDLPLFAEAPFEHPQTRSTREASRERLRRRIE